jgi:hypothetical protein
MVAAGVMVAGTTMSQSSRGDSWVIKHPGQHPSYSFELEPEVILVFDRPLADGPGAGVRGSIHIVDRAFVPSINDSIAITFGFDKDPLFRGNTFYIPAALQWNFWLSSHWSVAGEPGVLLQIADTVRPYFEVWACARYHFNDWIALTFRASLPTAPAVSFGVSFLF